MASGLSIPLSPVCPVHDDFVVLYSQSDDEDLDLDLDLSVRSPCRRRKKQLGE